MAEDSYTVYTLRSEIRSLKEQLSMGNARNKALSAKLSKVKQELEGAEERVEALLETNRILRSRIIQYRGKGYARHLDSMLANTTLDTVIELLCRFPFESTTKIAKDYGLNKFDVIRIANANGVIKSDTAKDEARLYLSKQGLMLKEERGGHNKKKVAMLAKNGRILDIFDSITEASIETGISESTIQYNCTHKASGRLNYLKYKGIRFRYITNND